MGFNSPFDLRWLHRRRRRGPISSSQSGSSVCAKILAISKGAETSAGPNLRTTREASAIAASPTIHARPIAGRRRLSPSKPVRSRNRSTVNSSDTLPRYHGGSASSVVAESGRTRYPNCQTPRSNKRDAGRWRRSTIVGRRVYRDVRSHLSDRRPVRRLASGTCVSKELLLEGASHPGLIAVG